MSLTPDITLYSLEASRSIRIAWLLEELKLPYTLISSPRAPNGLAPQDFKDKIPTLLGKSPALVDNGLVVQESGAIIEYICETYDPTHRLIPTARAPRAKVRELVAAAEATLLVHAMPILYAMLRIPDAQAATRDAFIESCAESVILDLDWLEHELALNLKRNEEVGSQGESSGRDGAGDGGVGERPVQKLASRILGGSTTTTPLYFVGDDLTAADMMMVVSVGLIFLRDLGTKGHRGTGRWALLEKWLDGVQALPAFKRAAATTGYFPKK